MIGGMVASPTPTVPMSGDSITVITVRVPGRARAKMLAAIQPAVPPPTMAMRLIRVVRDGICWVSDMGDQNLVSTRGLQRRLPLRANAEGQRIVPQRGAARRPPRCLLGNRIPFIPASCPERTGVL